MYGLLVMIFDLMKILYQMLLFCHMHMYLRGQGGVLKHKGSFSEYITTARHFLLQ